MADVWSEVASLDEEAQGRLADVLETRGSEPRQLAMRAAFLDAAGPLAGARVLDVGCGTGVLSRALAGRASGGSVLGIDAAPALLARARELSRDAPGLRFVEGDARALPLEDASADAVFLDSTLSHVPGPERAVAEAFRVLRPGGVLAVFDGDYATATVALGEDDPLQTAVEAMIRASVHDPWLVRRLPAMARDGGFEVERFDSHGFAQTGPADYMLSVVERGVEVMRAAGRIGEAAAGALVGEARGRVDEGRFFGFVAYGSLVARRPSATA
jgi:ubiquinone/menaquinone biosynthesis C-methylase UbiE